MLRFAFVAFFAFALLAGACSGSGTQASPTPAATAPAASASPSATATRTPLATLPVSTPTPTPVRTATASPTATATLAPPTRTPSPFVTGRVVSNGPRDSAAVALTFDMGGRVDPALDIMNWLIEHRVHATIFMTGAMAENANTGAGREVLRLLDQHRDLFALGNHSYSHPDFTTLTAAGMRDELERTEAAIAPYTALSARPFFRPPFGAQSAAVVAGAASAGYPLTVMWDVDTIDWRPESDGGPTADDIVAKVGANARGGSIVLMHLGGFNTLEALPRIVAGLEARGLTPVTLSGMLR